MRRGEKSRGEPTRREERQGEERKGEERIGEEGQRRGHRSRTRRMREDKGGLGGKRRDFVFVFYISFNLFHLKNQIKISFTFYLFFLVKKREERGEDIEEGR
jgi:hypothetical protein